jgi:hypothetical protein
MNWYATVRIYNLGRCGKQGKGKDNSLNAPYRDGKIDYAEGTLTDSVKGYLEKPVRQAQAEPGDIESQWQAISLTIAVR